MSEQIKAIRLNLTWDNAQDILAQIEDYYANNPKGEVVIRTYTKQWNIKRKVHYAWKDAKGKGYFFATDCGKLYARRGQKAWDLCTPMTGLWLA